MPGNLFDVFVVGSSDPSAAGETRLAAALSAKHGVPLATVSKAISAKNLRAGQGLEQAQAQAASMKREAEQRIQAEIELARTSLTKEVTAVAASATEKLLKEKVTADDQRGLVSTFIKDVDPGATPPSSSRSAT